MKVWGVDEMTLTQIAQDISVKLYEVREVGRALQFTLRPAGVRDDNGNYKWQRTSASMFHPDRRVFAVCWHGHYVFMDKIFEVNSKARIKTAFFDYKNREDFIKYAEMTGFRNVGAPAAPMQMREACNCWMAGDDMDVNIRIRMNMFGEK